MSIATEISDLGLQIARGNKREDLRITDQQVKERAAGIAKRMGMPARNGRAVEIVARHIARQLMCLPYNGEVTI